MRGRVEDGEGKSYRNTESNAICKRSLGLGLALSLSLSPERNSREAILERQQVRAWLEFFLIFLEFLPVEIGRLGGNRNAL